jgi:hypothetical protein
MVPVYPKKQHPLLRLMAEAQSFFPGVEKMLVFFYNRELKEIEARCVFPQRNPGEVETVNLTDTKALIQRFRSSKTPFSWQNKQSLPYEIKPSNQKQIEIFDEYQNVVLILRFPNQFDGLHDMLFIYFNERISSFGLNISVKNLSTDHKGIIGFMLYNFVNTFIRISEVEDKDIQSVVDSTRSVIAEHIRLREELSRTERNYGESLVDLCKNYSDEFSLEMNRQFRFHDSAIEKIKRYSGEIKHLRVIIKNAILFAEYLSGDSSSPTVLIHDFHINTSDYIPEKRKEEQIHYPEDKYSKTIQLLDRLESAARTVVHSKLKLTSQNVGRNCEKPISAPAITDALEKHRIKISDLFDRYPDKWELIRNEFKPIRNVLSS